MKKKLDYAPGLVAFLAVGMGISQTPKWNVAQEQLTHFGWATIGLGLSALVASMLLTYFRHKEYEFQYNQRKRLEEIAHAEVRLAIKQITWPFFQLFGDDNEKSMLELIPEHIEDPERMAVVLRIELRSTDRGGLSYGYFEETWDKVLKMNADNGTERIDRAMQIYATYLDPSVLELLYDLRTSEFLVLRLQRLDEHVGMNSQVKFLSFPFPGSRKGEDFETYGFGKFWRTVRKLDELLVKDPSRLQRRM